MGLINIGLQTAKNAIHTSQLGLEVTGNNIANANSTGYTRQRVVLQENRPVKLSPGIYMGTGVGLRGIQRMVDDFLLSRIRSATSDSASLSVQRQSLSQVEGLYNELTDTDLSSMMSAFFNSMSDLQNSPEEIARRQLVISQGNNLADAFRGLHQSFVDARSNANAQYVAAVDSINSLTGQIAELNMSIIRAEGGGTFHGSANQLRDRRDNILKELSDLVDIRTVEQASGSVNVFAGSHLLVYDAQQYELTIETTMDRNIAVAEAVFVDDGNSLEINGGRIQGYVVSRDEIYVLNMDRLDTMVSSLIFEINKLHSEGRGLDVIAQLTSNERVEDVDAALNDAGLAFEPVNGTFKIRVHNSTTGQIDVVQIDVDLDGIGSDDTLNTLAAKINTAMTGIGAPISATVNANQSFTLKSLSVDCGFTFADDTSGVLAALGMNTFFTGSDASDIDLSEFVSENLTYLAAALTDWPGDGGNAGRIFELQDVALEALGGLTIEDYYQSTISATAISSAVSKTQSEAADTYLDTLEAERESVSGVNLDEEAINLIRYQRTFQAAAKFIETINEMLMTMINLI